MDSMSSVVQAREAESSQSNNEHWTRFYEGGVRGEAFMISKGIVESGLDMVSAGTNYRNLDASFVHRECDL